MKSTIWAGPLFTPHSRGTAPIRCWRMFLKEKVVCAAPLLASRERSNTLGLGAWGLGPPVGEVLAGGVCRKGRAAPCRNHLALWAQEHHVGMPSTSKCEERASYLFSSNVSDGIPFTLRLLHALKPVANGSASHLLVVGRKCRLVAVSESRHKGRSSSKTIWCM